MRYFKFSKFASFMKDEEIYNDTLKSAMRLVESGHRCDNLGGDVYKLRMAREGKGKSGGYRVLIFYRTGERVFFAHGFAKSAQANITTAEKNTLKKQASVYMQLTDAQLDELVERCIIFEF